MNININNEQLLSDIVKTQMNDSEGTVTSEQLFQT